MKFELPIVLIDHDTGEERPVTACIDTETKLTTHVPRYVGEVMAELIEDELDG